MVHPQEIWRYGMATLVVVGFKKDIYRASEVLNKLSSMDDDWVVDLQDAVAVYRDDSGKLRMDQSYEMTKGEGAAWGALAGSLIGLALGAIAIPFTAGASAAVAGGALAAGALGGGAVGAASGAINAAWWKDNFGISDDFIKEISGMVRLGDSAIVALLRTVDPDYVAEQFRDYGGTVLRSTLTQEQSEKLQAVLDGRK
jgi:uncharacterized membrane protein